MKTIYYLLISITLILIYSCQPKGCTDSNALNYSVDAEEEDGSCCSVVADPEKYNCNIIDTVSADGHPFLNKTIAIFRFTNTTEKLAGENVTVCDKYYNQKNEYPNYSTALILENNIDSAINISFNIEYYYGNNQIWNYENTVEIEVGKTFDVGVIKNRDPLVNSDNMKITINNIDYK